LSAAIDIELDGGMQIEQAVGNYITTKHDDNDYRLLCSIKNKDRLMKISNRVDSLNIGNDPDECMKVAKEIEDFQKDYKKLLGESLGRSLTNQSLDEKSKRINDLSNENTLLKSKLKVQEKKEYGKKRYEKSIKKRASHKKRKKKGK
jgi:hypothetical protein